jgi:hypothetical protein
MATPMIAAIAANWVDDGTATHLIEWQIAALTRRYLLAKVVRTGVDFRASPYGCHIWLPLPDPRTEE